MKKLSLLQKLANLTKAALSPWATNPDNTSTSGSGRSNPILAVAGPPAPAPAKPAVPAKLTSQLNINVANPNLAGNFNYDNLIRPTTRRFLNRPQTSRELIAYLNKLKYRPYRTGGGHGYRLQPSPYYQQQPYLLPQQPQPHYTVGQYIRKYPPTPAGVPYRTVRPIYDSDGVLDNINAYTDVLNESGLYPEELSSLDSDAAESLSDDISPNDTVYLVDARDAANWLYSRRGLDLTDELWARMNSARLRLNSQLNRMPQTMYYAWSDNDDTGGYSLSFNGDRDENNLFFNVFNPNRFDQPYYSDDYNGYGLYLQHGLLLEPWLRYMLFLDVQDHELSHAFNDSPNYRDRTWVWDGMDSGWKPNMFFRMTNNPTDPYYDDNTTEDRSERFGTIFDNTYASKPSEYIGAMGRVKRYGAELGYDTTSADPTTSRNAMAHTLHYLATHPHPELLSPELQRLHSWLNTAALNHMQAYSLDYKDRVNALEARSNSEEELRQRAIQRLLFELNIDADKANYIKDPESQFYMDVLDFMTDSTIQGLVRNDVPNNNTNALQNLRPIYA